MSNPQIRFTKDDGTPYPDWGEVKLGEVLTEQNDRNRELLYSDVWSVNNKLGFIKQKEQFDNREVASKDLSNYKLIFKNTYAYNPSRINVGSIARSNFESVGIVSPMYITFKILEKVLVEFFDQYLSTHIFQERVRNSTSGSVRDSLNFTALCDFKIPLPCLEEQQKIAEFFSGLDAQIEAEDAALASIEAHKRGMLQGLFPQGGAQPQKRFTKDDGTPYPDWAEVKLGEVLTESKEQGTNGLLAKKLSVKLWNKGVVEKKETLAGSKQTVYFKRKAGQLIYSKLDFLNCAFGIIPSELDGYESTIDLPCFDISKKINGKFLLSTITQANFYKKYGVLANGTRVARRIHQDFFLNLQIPLPCLEEQQKIAEFFSALDAQIEAQRQKCMEIKNYKRAMLQRMFK